ATAQCRRGARAWLCKEENRRQEIRRLERGEGSDGQAGEGEEVNATQVARLRTAPAILRGLSLSVDRPLAIDNGTLRRWGRSRRQNNRFCSTAADAVRQNAAPRRETAKRFTESSGRKQCECFTFWLPRPRWLLFHCRRSPRRIRRAARPAAASADRFNSRRIARGKKDRCKPARPSAGRTAAITNNASVPACTTGKTA